MEELITRWLIDQAPVIVLGVIFGWRLVRNQERIIDRILDLCLDDDETKEG